jgi:hypothetical protein
MHAKVTGQRGVGTASGQGWGLPASTRKRIATLTVRLVEALTGCASCLLTKRHARADARETSEREESDRAHDRKLAVSEEQRPAKMDNTERCSIRARKRVFGRNKHVG